MTQDILFSQQGPIGLITLNRVSALNALTLTMIKELQQQLIAWKEDESVVAIVIRSAAGKAFCAGGDVRWLYECSGQREEQMEFFWHEYRLNYFIHQLGKPYVALMDGITMGGGVGISMHGSHPIASERFVFAMPETSIGFFPDIGASHLLTQCPGSLGIYLGLTGNSLNASEAQKAGLIKGIIAAKNMPLVLDALSNADWSDNSYQVVDRCLQRYLQVADDVTPISIIEECFSQDSVEYIIHMLEHHEETFAREIGKLLRQKSPFSLELTLAQLHKARGKSLADCLKMDFNLVRNFMMDHDFYEGVRALLIDKDKNPRWSPLQLELVEQSKVVSYFAPAVRQLEFIQ